MKETTEQNPKLWADEFQAFLASDEKQPPASARAEIFTTVHRDLFPALWLVMAKLAGIHLVAGTLSLALCSQFGIGGGYNLMQNFMSYGIFACMAACGSIFVGLTLVAAGFLLTKPELGRIRQTVYTPILLLSVVSLVVLFLFGAQIALGWAAFWLLGAVITGAVITEVSIGLRALSRG